MLVVSLEQKVKKHKTTNDKAKLNRVFGLNNMFLILGVG
jgi:hypothetical protein